MTAREVAKRINTHLRRFEADPAINRYGKDHSAAQQGLRPYFNTGAVASGRWVHVTYISYQRSQPLTLSDAQRYLAALDAGFVGRHYEAFRKLSAEAR